MRAPTPAEQRCALHSLTHSLSSSDSSARARHRHRAPCLADQLARPPRLAVEPSTSPAAPPPRAPRCRPARHEIRPEVRPNRVFFLRAVARRSTAAAHAAMASPAPPPSLPLFARTVAASQWRSSVASQRRRSGHPCAGTSPCRRSAAPPRAMATGHLAPVVLWPCKLYQRVRIAVWSPTVPTTPPATSPPMRSGRSKPSPAFG